MTTKQKIVGESKFLSMPEKIHQLKQHRGCGGGATGCRSGIAVTRWTGRRYNLGTNKDVFDAETFAIYQALRALGRAKRADTEAQPLP